MLEVRDRGAAERERLLAEREKLLDARGVPSTSGQDDAYYYGGNSAGGSAQNSRPRTPTAGALLRGPLPPPLALASKARTPSGGSQMGDRVASWGSLSAAAGGSGSGGGIRRIASTASLASMTSADFCAAPEHQGDEAAGDGPSGRAPRRNASLSGAMDSAALSELFNQVREGEGGKGRKEGRGDFWGFSVGHVVRQ